MPRIHLGNANALPFQDDSFDVVVSTGSIHHWKEPEKGLGEIFRFLKKGGYCLVYDLVSDTPKEVLRQMARQFGPLRMVFLWLHTFEEPFYTRENLILLAEKSPFGQGGTRFISVMCCLILKKT